MVASESMALETGDGDRSIDDDNKTSGLVMVIDGGMALPSIIATRKVVGDNCSHASGILLGVGGADQSVATILSLM